MAWPVPFRRSLDTQLFPPALRWFDRSAPVRPEFGHREVFDMTGGPGAKDAPYTLGEDEPAGDQALFGLGEEDRRELVAWVGENLTEVRETAVGSDLSIGSFGPPWWPAWRRMSVGT